jgi:hypothetical protein
LRLPVNWVSSAKQKTTQSSNLSKFFLYFLFDAGYFSR